MGRAKQLIEIDGKPLIRHSLDIALRCCKRVILVEGSIPLSSVLPASNRVKIIHNHHHKKGQLGSLQMGIQARETQLFYVLLADLIYIKPSTFFKLADAIKTHHVVYPVCNEKRGHPVLMDGEAAKFIAKASPNRKAMEIVQNLSPVPIPVNDPGIFTDIDTQEDLDCLIQKNTKH